MKKNNYVKPTMVVVELKHRAPLICQSPGDPIPGGAPRLYDWDMDVEAELSE